MTDDLFFDTDCLRRHFFKVFEEVITVIGR